MVVGPSVRKTRRNQLEIFLPLRLAFDTLGRTMLRFLYPGRASVDPYRVYPSNVYVSIPKGRLLTGQGSKLVYAATRHALHDHTA